MNSIDIISAKNTIETYINGLNLPKEVIRMMLKEIYQKAEKDAYEEAMKQAEEREKEDGKS